MKKLSTYLFLLLFSFQTSSWADDIRDFQIEGMSIGDSLLDYFSAEIIEEKKKEKINFPKSKKFYRIVFKSNEVTYDFIGVYLKKNDSNYIIYSLEGLKYMDYLPCKNKKKTVKNELNNIFEDKYKIETREEPHTFDKSKKSIVDITEFVGENNYLVARIICTDWSKKMGKKHSFYDLLSIYLNSKEFSDFIIYEAY